MRQKVKDLLERGSVESVSDVGMTVVVDGVELYVGTRINHTGCHCCGDAAELSVRYNRFYGHRIEKHESEDPLGIKD